MTPRTSKKATPSAKPHLPIRWDELRHEELWQAAIDEMESASLTRSFEDSRRHVLRGRLKKLDTSEHKEYLQIECARIVETLRRLRDLYCQKLESDGCRPIAQMQWKVFRAGIIQYAVKVLRLAAIDYIITAVTAEEGRVFWKGLYGWNLLKFNLAAGSPVAASDLATGEAWVQAVSEDVHSAVTELSLSDHSYPGGMFSREAQLHWAEDRRWPSSRWGETDMVQELEMRQEIWDASRPWSDGLTQLFDATRAEVDCQYRALPAAARRAAQKYANLTPFEEIVHKHLSAARLEKLNPKTFKEGTWLALMRELDQQGINLEGQLSGRPKEIQAALRKQGRAIECWEECLDAKLGATLADGKRYLLKREVTRALQSAARRAATTRDNI